MRTQDFDFELPASLIAQRPARPRDSARLLAVGRNLSDRRMHDLPQLLDPGDLLVVNDTRVIPTRLSGRRGAARVEITLHKQISPASWLAYVRPARKVSPADHLDFPGGMSAEVKDKGGAGEITLSFAASGGDLLAYLETQGGMPLPPYIRKGKGDAQDLADYQTLHAKVPGAVAAPTAGLHLTEALKTALTARGVTVTSLTLHIGAGTFAPVRSEDPRAHSLHREWGAVGENVAAAVEAARARGGRIVACGTTALRLLESAADESGRLRPFRGETGIYILPGYRFRLVERLLTNFHLPRSTLFMLVSAFSGLARMQAAYAHAVARGYRFYSYGDATLLTREDLL
ncbi:MAG: tRNA preQ1(34) S-adenosylmethionine ribosyltransferase-isomerase QueA [Rhodospirillales bacterium]|nr:tRNA preQ1(34) S-adenosylmethionine ribosyltransferase-isomerase QueA [Rhodospirillales bacterium]